MKKMLVLSVLSLVIGLHQNLHAQGQVRITPNGMTNGGDETPNSNEIEFKEGAFSAEIDLLSDGSLRLGVGSSPDEFTINSNGNVGIGTTDPFQKLHIVGNRLRIAAPGNPGKYLEWRTDGNDMDMSSTGAKLFLTGNNSAGVIIQQNPGNVAIGNDTSPDYKLEVVGSAGKSGGGLWSDSSDRRLKKDIEDFKGGLAEILKIRPVWYRFNGKFGLPTEERYVGVIAQEIQEVAPYTVSTYIETDDETGETGEYLNYNGTAVIYMLVNAIQEQQEDLEEKEARSKKQEAMIQDLKANNEQLEARLAKLEAIVLGKTSNEQLNQQTTTLTDARLYPNQPNPFNESTLIRYYLPEGSANGEIQITNLEGKIIKSVPIQAKGEGQLTLNAQALSAGMYLYSLFVNGELIATEKMILAGSK